MGTNYYRIKPIYKEERDRLHKALDDVLDKRGCEYELNEMLEEVKKDHEVHICKSSCGWQINFDHNWGKYYKPDRKSLEDFLSEEGTWIEDEYGDKISYDEFWYMVKTHNEMPRNKWTSKTYREDKKNIWVDDSIYCRDSIEKCKMMFGIDSNGETDFEVDGLRFAVFSDFS